MRMSHRALATALLAAAFAPATAADGLTPGSVLIYPIHRSGLPFNGAPTGPAIIQAPFFSVIAVTNTNLVPATPTNGLGGSTNIHWDYVNAVFNQQLGSNFPDCVVQDRVEFLTPGDTRVVLTNCHNPSFGTEGYLVITAQDPNVFSTAWSHNFLVGSEFVINSNLLVYHINAIPFDALDPAGAATDHDLDGELDFDGIEYEPIPDHLYLDFFVDALGSSLVLINMSGGFAFTAVVAFDIFNDNEQALSATLSFRCWIEKRLQDISLVFSQGFLAANTNHNPAEFDLNCDGVGDVETGWARIRGLTNSSSVESYSNPALLGAHSKNIFTAGGRRLWESTAKQTNGDFFKTATNDPEVP